MIGSRLTTALICLVLLMPCPALAGDKCKAVYGTGEISFTVATGSPGELGLLAAWAKAFGKKHDVTICWRKAGSGAALKMLKAHQVDLALVHAPMAEKQALAQGWARDRYPLGSNRFFIVGPKNDPAQVTEASSAVEAYARIHRAGAKFVSRADGSGTHKREQALWQKAGLKPSGAWYLAKKNFMLAALLLAAKQEAYFMTDSSTWYVARARHGLADMAVLFQGDPMLINHYHALTPPLGATPGANLAKKFAEFMASSAGQAILAVYGKKDYGHALYRPAQTSPTTSK